MGILPESYPTDPPKFEPRVMAMQNEENYVFAYEDGLFEPVVDVGDEVEDGQFAGYIWNVRQPWREPTRLHFRRGGRGLHQAASRPVPDRRHALLHPERLRGLTGLTENSFMPATPSATSFRDGG